MTISLLFSTSFLEVGNLHYIGAWRMGGSASFVTSLVGRLPTQQSPMMNSVVLLHVACLISKRSQEKGPSLLQT